MKKALTLFLIFFIYVSANSQTNVSGTINADSTWNLAGSPYIVNGQLTITAGYTLTIDAGVEVRFDNGRALYSHGNINASNTTFTSNDPSPSPGQWSTITFYSGSASTFSDCLFEYAAYINVASGANLTLTGSTIENMGYYGIKNEGALFVTNGVVDMQNFTSAGYGIYTLASGITQINNTNIMNSYHAVYVDSDNSLVAIQNCTFSSNTYPVYLNAACELAFTGSNVFSGNTYEAVYIHCTSMSTDWDLPFVSVPYVFHNGFTVNNGTTLSVASENILKFRSGSLSVNGLFQAVANTGEKIYFTSWLDDNWGGDSNGDGTATAPTTGAWQGIRFNDACDDASIMERCKVRYAGSTSYGAITIIDASPTIDFCEFQQNYFGAYFQYASNPVFTNNIVGSSTLTPIAMSFEANPVLSGNILSFSDNQYDAIGLIGGPLTADAHIIKRNFTNVNNITYYILSDITIPQGKTLTIDPGVVIKSSSYSHRIRVQGKLVANGTSSEYITFTSVKDDNHGNPGDTNKDGTLSSPATNDISALIFETGHDPTSSLDYVRIKYAGVYNFSYLNGGSNHNVHGCAVAVLNQTATSPPGPTISNCEIRESAYGISCFQASNPVISSNSFINITNTPLSMAGSANPVFSGNAFTNCGINALGLIGHNVVSNGTISQKDVAGYANITYVLLEPIVIKNGAYLEIDSGIVIKQINYTWSVEGGLKICGTTTDHVIFTSLYDDNVGNPMDTNGDGNATTPNKGNWNRIEFLDISDDSYCVINYSDLKYGGSYMNPIIRTVNASPAISHSLVDQSGYYGLKIEGNSAPVINHVTIQNCGLDPVAMSLTSNPSFSGVSFSANGSSGIFLLEGTLSSNAYLQKRNVAGLTNIAYIIDELSISTNAILTLEQGIVLKFRGSGSNMEGIIIYGGLNAIGTSADKIIFTSFSDDSAGGDTNNDGSSTVPSATDWDGLIYYPEGDDTANKLVYCEVRYGGGGHSSPFGSESHNGAVRIKDAFVDIDHVKFQQGNFAALGIYGSANPDINNCQIYNFENVPVFMSMFSNPVFSNNTVANVKYLALGIQNETYSQSATFPTRDFAGYSNITYMHSGFTINSGTSISIPAGMVFKGSTSRQININGKIEVDGTAGNPVVFTDYRDDDFGNPADTEQNGTATVPSSAGYSLQFNDVCDDNSYINNAVLRYRANPVVLTSASPDISNNTFFKSTHAISCSGVSSPSVTNNIFDDLTHAPISISLVSYPSATSGNTITGTTFKGIAVKNETLTQDVTLSKRSFAGLANAPYIFENYTIGPGVTLTLDTGVICKFSHATSLTVNNGLIAEGTAVSGGKIVFTSITDDYFGGDTNADSTITNCSSINWRGININNQAIDPLTRFEHCIFRNTGWYGAIQTTSASPSIQYCSFNNHTRGIYATAASNPLINFCDFTNIQYEAVNNLNQSFVINAENCWWGDNTGPTHAGNPGGIGEPVTDAVDYDPWGQNGAINPLAGDVSLNSLIQAYDATLILLYLVNPGTYPLTGTQLNVADVSGNGGTTAYDASLVLQYVVGLISTFPSQMLSPVPYYTPDAGLVIGNAEVLPDQEFELPVSITNANEASAFEITLSFDTQFIQVESVENLVPEMNSTFNIEMENGLIRMAFAGAETLENDINIANIRMKSTAVSGGFVTTSIEAQAFMANETNLSANVTNGQIIINGFAVGTNSEIEQSPELITCYPNPFNNKLNIRYCIPGPCHVNIAIYDIYGKLIDEIVNEKQVGSFHEISFDTGSVQKEKFSPGIYYIRIIAGNRIYSKKIQFIR